MEVGAELPGHSRLAETAKAMKMIDPSIKLVSCGSSFKDMPTFRNGAITLEHTYDYVDYISLHQYYGNRAYADYLAMSVDMEQFIETVMAAIMSRQKRSRKNMVSFDEWRCGIIQ